MSLRNSHEAKKPSSGPKLEIELNPDGGTFSGFVAKDDGPNSFDHSTNSRACLKMSGT